MAHATAWHGHNTTCTLSTATIDSALLLSVDWSGVSRTSIETTYLGTAAGSPGTNFGTKTFIPAGTSDPGEITFEFLFNPDTCDVPIDVAAETVTVTWVDGASDSANWSGSGFCTGFSLNTADEEAMTCTATYKMTSNVTMA